MRKKKDSIKSLKKKAWKYFSLWVRLRDADQKLNVRCVTCGAIMNYKDIQAGHFISRSKTATMFDERNVNPQCYRCNVALHGNLAEYAVYLQSVYGEGIIKELIQKSKQPHRFTKQELLEMISKYTDMATAELEGRGYKV